MSSFHLNFLREDGDQVSASAPRQIVLAGFGKHPGWDDHLEDIGLATRTLEAAKSLIYIDGIGNQIDTGAWDKLEPDQLREFNHLFIWCRSDQTLMGRIWASRDGKGRAKYPMIACLHSFGLPLPWLLANGLPRLNDLVQKCRATTEAQAVIQAFAATQAELQGLARSTVSPPDSSAAAGTHERLRARFLADPILKKEGEGLTRVLYCLERQMGAYLPMKKGAVTQTGWPAPQQIRVPKFAGSLEENALMWSWFFASQCAKNTPTLLVLPLDAPWVDVILGEPTGHELFCLRAGSRVLALATTIPYTLDAAAREKTAQSLAALASVGQSTGSFTAQPLTADKGKVRQWLFVMLILMMLIGGTIVIIWFFGGDRAPAPSLPRATPPPDPIKTKQAPVASIPEPPPVVEQGKLLLTSDPPDVEIYWRTTSGDQLLGTIGATFLRTKLIDQGLQTLVARHPVLGEQMISVAVRTDTVVAANVVFPYGSVSIQAEPSAVSATVFQDNAKLGTAPWFGAIIRTGAVHYVVQAEGYSAVNLAGEVLPGQTNEFVAVLKVAVPDPKLAALHQNIHNSFGMEFVWVDGVPGTDAGCWVSTAEVSRRDFQLVMAKKSGGTNQATRAAGPVSDGDAREFCRQLSELEHNAVVTYEFPSIEQWNYLEQHGYRRVAGVEQRDFLVDQPVLEKGALSRVATGGPGQTLQQTLDWDDHSRQEPVHQQTLAGFRCLAIMKPKAASPPVP